MPLTDAAIKNAKPEKKAVKLFDGRGLYLEVTPAGGKWWRVKYRFQGKENSEVGRQIRTPNYAAFGNNFSISNFLIKAAGER